MGRSVVVAGRLLVQPVVPCAPHFSRASQWRGFSTELIRFTDQIKEKRTSGWTVSTVFGCTGFVGRYVVNRLGRIGSQVITPYRGEEKAINHLKVMGDVGQIAPCPFSIRDPASIDLALSNASIVVNCLGRHYDTRNFTMEEANVKSVERIAQAAKKRGVERFIHISAVGADENSPSKWLRTKAQGEKVLKQILPNAVILRCTHIFGDEDRLLNKYGFFVKFSPVIPVLTPLTTKLQPIYVGDVALAVQKIIQLPEPTSLGDIFELGGPKVFTMEEFLRDIIIHHSLRHSRIILPIPDPFKKWVAWALEQRRQPLFTVDDGVFSGDIVTSSKPGLQTLHVTPTPIDEMALRILRQYRMPVRFES